MLLLLALLLSLSPAAPAPLPTIEEKTAGFERQEGFFPLYWDAAEGRVWLEIPRFEEAFLYAVSLPAGLGSNDVGLDRTQLGGEQLVRFERIGPKILLVAPNLRFRADSESEAERRSVEDAFAPSVVWGFTAAAETGGRVLVDATEFIVRDAHGVVRRLRDTRQGTFRLDVSRSAPHLERTKAFPKNTEMEARLTFVSEDPGAFVREVAADPHAITLRVRHSFVELPPPGYEPRAFDPRSGYFAFGYDDYAAPIGEDRRRRLIVRHRLEKKDPAAAVSEPVEPIVYYLDPGTPEPVRSALLDGARWWAEAFRAAGFRDAFRVEMLPEGADPMDVRYNVIEWVHRSTRGWSYGASVVDPRTGEIIKGHVLLGSLRVRQDYLLAEGLLAPYDGARAGGMAQGADPMLEMALARIRQLSAHEVGHTLGLAHNFAASAHGRSSVMDYPAPEVTIRADGTLSLEADYASGIGAWDVLAIRYGYTEFPAGTDEAAALEALLDEAAAGGLRYLTDADARPAGAANPEASLWDNGADPVSALAHELEVRSLALSRFGAAAVREGRPLTLLHEVLVPLYLRHRYAVDAAVKLLGGAAYGYPLRGDEAELPRTVPAARQEAALDVLLSAVRPEALRLPEHVRALLAPRVPGYEAHRELFEGDTDPLFDPYGAARAAAVLVLDQIAQPERAARLAYQQDFLPETPGLLDVFGRVTGTLFTDGVPGDGYDAELQRVTQQAWVDALVRLATDAAAPAVSARTLHHLRGLQQWLAAHPGAGGDDETAAHRAALHDELTRYLARPYRPGDRPARPALPAGSPIGAP